MKAASNNLKMRVLGALEHAPGESMNARYKAVSQMTFSDDDGLPRRFTWRTIQTWWWYYRNHGVTSPVDRSDKGTMRKVTPEEVLEAVQKALPLFRNDFINIQSLYRKCIEQGFLRRDQIAPNTFRRAVNKYDMLKGLHEGSPKARKAFAKAHANDMWQADTLHGPYIRIDGKPTLTYLICFIDDASRVIPHGEFYTADDTPNLLNSLQNALYKRGVPQSMYVDNGSNYSSKEFSTICMRLGCLLIHTPVRDGASKGKIERFFRTVRDQFLSQNLADIRSLAELNQAFTRWVEDSYHQREHSTLGMKPIDRFGLDLNRIRYLTSSEYSAELFYLETTRSVRADNTFSYNNRRYEAPRDLRKQTILIRYSRATPDEPPIAYSEGVRLGAAQPVDFQANDRKPLPETY